MSKTLKELLEERVVYLEKRVKLGDVEWESWEEDVASCDYEGAGSCFGHADDCFERGIERGWHEEASDELYALKNILKKS